MSVTKSNTIQDELNRLHDIQRKSWRQIAQIPKFKGMPVRTLSAIASGKREVPQKFRERLGLPETAPAPVCEIHGGVDCYICGGKVGKPKPRRRKWNEISTKDLAWALENRHPPRW